MWFVAGFHIRPGAAAAAARKVFTCGLCLGDVHATDAQMLYGGKLGEPLRVGWAELVLGINEHSTASLACAGMAPGSLQDNRQVQIWWASDRCIKGMLPSCTCAELGSFILAASCTI